MYLWACVLLVFHLLLRPGVCQANGTTPVETHGSLTSQDRADFQIINSINCITLDQNRKSSSIALSCDKFGASTTMLSCDKFGASIQSTHPITASNSPSDTFYFEMTITSGWPVIGLATRDFYLDREPGAGAGSYGYTGLSNSRDKKKGTLLYEGIPLEYGESFSEGDTVGCGYILSYKYVFFTKNGKHLGIAFKVTIEGDLYPTFGIIKSGGMQVNFGQKPFAYGKVSPVTTNLRCGDIPTLDPNRKFDRIKVDCDVLEGDGSVQSTHPVQATNIASGIYYFEITILSGTPIIGLATHNLDLENPPGGAPESYGYFGYPNNRDRKKGYLLCPSKTAIEPYGETFSKGDTVGCGYNLLTKNVFFTKNGKDLGMACTVTIEDELYPTIGFFSDFRGKVQVNLGNKPFLFGIN